MKIEDEVLERLRHLPDERKADVLRYVARVEAEIERARVLEGTPARAAASMRWLSEHRAEYAGQWVALDGARLIASGEDGREVAARVRREGVEGPFVTRVETADEQAFCGGWL